MNPCSGGKKRHPLSLPPAKRIKREVDIATQPWVLCAASDESVLCSPSVDLSSRPSPIRSASALDTSSNWVSRNSAGEQQSQGGQEWSGREDEGCMEPPFEDHTNLHLTAHEIEEAHLAQALLETSVAEESAAPSWDGLTDPPTAPPSTLRHTLSEGSTGISKMQSYIEKAASRPLRDCPFYKHIPSTSIIVDGFPFAFLKLPRSKLQPMYFLTHWHSDHYGGLSSSFSRGDIYCSEVTAALLRFQFPSIGMRSINCLSSLSIQSVSNV